MPTEVERRASLGRCLRDLAIAAADLALYCDRTEHAEPAPTALIGRAAATLRECASLCADALEVDLVDAYAARLGEVEARGAHHLVADYDGAAAARVAATWCDLHAVQARHDRAYHPDVVGMSRADQTRHCALHAAKLAGCVARALDDDAARHELRDKRVADMLIFGLKLADIAREVLARQPLRDDADVRSVGLRLARSRAMPITR